jgi:outer membrane protein assembly factor BamE (lipoprotein component of BamABCDE complex)
LSRKSSKSISAALVLLLAAGCTTMSISRNPRDIDSNNLQKLERGVTTKKEVIELFGAPVAITLTADGFEVYTFASGMTASQVWQVPPIFVIYADSASSAKTKVLSITFSGDTMINWTYTVSSAGGGFQAGGVQGGRFEGN